MRLSILIEHGSAKSVLSLQKQNGLSQAMCFLFITEVINVNFKMQVTSVVGFHQNRRGLSSIFQGRSCMHTKGDLRE